MNAVADATGVLSEITDPVMFSGDVALSCAADENWVHWMFPDPYDVHAPADAGWSPHTRRRR